MPDGNPLLPGPAGNDSDGGKLNRSSGGSIQIGLGVIVGVPWLMHTTVSMLFAMAFHHYKLLVMFIVLVWLMISTFFMVLDQRGRMSGSWFLLLGLLCYFAVLSGSVGGSYNYYTYMFPYWSYTENREYTNVLPTEPADAHSDAGKIVFADSARVDTTRSIGFKAGTVYCVAPIMDDTQLDHVEYWAAGTDCCQSRGDFNCDDTWNPKAKSGVVLLDTASADTKVPRRAQNVMFLFGKTEQDYFVQAAREAEASFQITSAERPLFVRWVADAQAIQDDYWRSGVGFLLAGACIYLLFSIVVGSGMHMYSKRQASAAGATMG